MDKGPANPFFRPKAACYAQAVAESPKVFLRTPENKTNGFIADSSSGRHLLGCAGHGVSSNAGVEIGIPPD
jgi:hypothetical protein